MSLQTTLCDAASSSQDAFRECLSIPELARDNWIENKLGDFNLWMATLHVRDTGHASLDYRLRERQDIKDVIQVLLDTLTNSLYQCKIIAEDGKAESCMVPTAEDAGLESDDTDSSLSSLSSTWDKDRNEIFQSQPSKVFIETPLWEEASNAEVTLDQLIRLGVAIRKSGTRFRHSNADRSLNKKNHRDLERHLTFILLYGTLEHCLATEVLSLVHRQIISPATGIVIKSMLLNPARLTRVQQRIIHANIIRRNRFEFMWRRFQRTEVRSLQEHPQKKPFTPVEPKNPTLCIKHADPPAMSETVEQTVIQKSLDPSTIMTATRVGSEFMPQADTPKKPATQVTKVSATGLTLDYPKSPGDLKGQKVFQCPYCCHMLPEKYAKAGWNAHIHHDVSPYICIFQDCSTPDQLYASKEEWLSHLRSQHSARCWKCPFQTFGLCSKSRFVTEEDWINHIKNYHKNEEAITDAQLQILARINMTQELSMENCPLCGFLNKDDQKSTIDHVAQHFHSFSLRALPWIRFSEEESNQSQGSRRGLSFVDSLNTSGSSINGSAEYSQTWNSISAFLDRVSIIVGRQQGYDGDLEAIVQSFLPKLQAWYSVLQGKAEDLFTLIEKEDRDLASRINSCLMDIILRLDILEEYCTDNPDTRSLEELQNLQNQLVESVQDLLAQQNAILTFKNTFVESRNNTTEITTDKLNAFSLTHDDYTVGWVCASPLEMAAAKVMLDQVHPSLPQPKSDHNVYTFGSISGHNVAIACLTYGVYGTTSAAIVLAHMLLTFPSLQFGLMVGIGGGVPSKSTDIRLGDVVVGIQTANPGGVVQYDYGKTLRDRHFQPTKSLLKPPQFLLTALSEMRSNHMVGERPITGLLFDILQKHQDIRERFSRPDNDWLFNSGYDHQSTNPDCSACDQTQLVDRKPRATEEPHIHYGLIASGNQVMKDAKRRDSIAQEMDILCFEMEAAGLMDQYQLPCLVIRGICDYCDSHKHKQWQGYAALAAAAYARTLLMATYTTNKSGWTPINSASDSGHLEVVKFLYEHGADADIHTPSNDGWTPLYSASSHGHLEVVKFLYEHGADADIHTPSNDGWTPLYSASSNGHLEVVKFLYEHGADADIHTATNDGWTPLYSASSNGHLEVVKFLYEHGAVADIHTPSNDGWTPLYSASSHGHLEVIKFLYDHGADADIHTPSNDGWTPLYSASSNGHLEVVKFLYEHGTDADIHTATNDGWTPLYSASDSGHLEVVKFLYEHGADADIHTPSNDGWIPLYSASSHGHLEVVKFLYEHGADADIHTPSNDGWTPLYSASSNGHLEVVKFLYEHGADADIHTPSNHGWTPLYSASPHGHLEVVKFLYEHGADADIHTPSNHGWTPINSASSHGHLEVVKFLYEHGADADIHTPSNHGWTPINSASSHGHLEVIKFLYEHGADADIHTPSNDGWTPINSASSHGHLEVVKFLYEHGADADIHIPSNDGWTPLYSASDSGHLEVVKLLYEHGADADIHTPSNDGWTPINSASDSGHLEVVKFLYEHGADADIHTPSNDGWTPLYSASSHGHLEVVKFLYEHGADADIHTPSNDGWTPLYSALSNGHLAVVKFLYEHGADADIHTASNDGWTPINSASDSGHLEVASSYMLPAHDFQEVD